MLSVVVMFCLLPWSCCCCLTKDVAENAVEIAESAVEIAHNANIEIVETSIVAY